MGRRAQINDNQSSSFLTPEQVLFVEEYARDLNAARAVNRARESAGVPETSRDSAASDAADWLKNPVIAERVRARMEELAASRNLTPRLIIDQLLPIALLDPRRVVNWGPREVVLHDSSNLTRDDAVAVSEVTQTVTKDGGSIKVKFHDKIKALELLGKYIHMWDEKDAGARDFLGELATWSEERLRARLTELASGPKS